MRIAGSIITAICGIVVIVGVFLTWIDFSYGYMSCGITGLDLIKGSFTCMGQSVSDLGSAIEAWLILGGGIVMTAFAIPAFIVSLAAKGGKAAIITLSIFAIVGALVAIGGGIWTFIDVGGEGLSYLAYGFYIAFAAAIVGFIFAILTAVFSKGKQDW
jgi:hypothetical protein